MPEPRARRASLTQTGPRGPEFRLGKSYRACSSPDRAFGSGPKGSRFDSCQAHFSWSFATIDDALGRGPQRCTFAAWRASTGSCTSSLSLEQARGFERLIVSVRPGVHQVEVGEQMTMQTKSNLAAVNGIELGYQEFGEGKPLILLHGGFGSVEMFGPNVDLLAAGHRVIGVDLQSHGRSPAVDRTMRFETMADDIAALIGSLGLERAAIMGFSLGGGVALRVAIQHPELVQRLVLLSTVFKRQGWYPEMRAGMDTMGPETAEFLKQSPMYEAYKQIAPKVDDWPVLVTQLSALLKVDYDWSEEIPGLPMPVMIIIGDADGIPPSHAVEFFRMLGGGLRDANWDRSGMTRHRLAILPGWTHYDINVAPALSATVIPFLDSE